MHFLLLIVIIVLLIILLSKSNSKRYFTDLRNSINLLNDKIKTLTNSITALQKEKETLKEKLPVVEKSETIIQPAVIEKPPIQMVDVTDATIKDKTLSELIILKPGNFFFIDAAISAGEKLIAAML